MSDNYVGDLAVILDLRRPATSTRLFLGCYDDFDSICHHIYKLIKATQSQH